MNDAVIQAATAALDNQRPINVANDFAKATLEYDTAWVHGLTFTGGVYYTGNQAINTPNTIYIPPYVTENVGFRLTTGNSAHQVVYRFAVENLSNQWYWLDEYYTGAPRTFAGSIEFKM